MNFKMNVWTLLFAITAGALVYMISIGKDEVTPTVVRHANEISAAQALNRYEDYHNLYVRQLMIDSIFDKTNTFELNTDVHYFWLQEDELAQMVKVNNGKRVYAIPMLKRASGGARDTLDLMFAAVAKVDTAVNLWAEGRFFDFSRPCPPTCDSSLYTVVPTGPSR